MNRSKWKGPYLHRTLFGSIPLTNNFKIWSRKSLITSNFIGSNVLIYNGKEFKRVFINREKVGYKFGEFSLTRKYTRKEKTFVTKKKSKK